MSILRRDAFVRQQGYYTDERVKVDGIFVVALPRNLEIFCFFSFFFCL
jgi:hypothetical protein